MKSALDAAAAAAADDDDSQYHKHWLHAATVCSASSLHITPSLHRSQLQRRALCVFHP